MREKDSTNLTLMANRVSPIRIKVRVKEKQMLMTVKNQYCSVNMAIP